MPAVVSSKIRSVETLIVALPTRREHKWTGLTESIGRYVLVTEADVASQEVIRDKLLAAFPGHGFLAEENEQIASRDDDYRWIVDPLDGTMNYVHGVPNYSVSIALECDGGKPSQRGKIDLLQAA